MKLFGITGGIGMGKSTAGELLQKRGLPVIDTDIIAREIVRPGQPALKKIEAEFGSQMIAPDGTLRRDELARVVFPDAEARRKLEGILHPQIREVWQAQAEVWKKEGRAIGFVIIPLLFETNAAANFAATICVACSEKSQRERLLNRNWSAEQLQQRIEAQFPTKRKIELADYVVWTETTLAAHSAQWDFLLRKFLK